MVKRIKNSFIRGVGSVMVIYPRKRYVIKNPSLIKGDAERLRGDWIKVGGDISKSIRSYKYAR